MFFAVKDMNTSELPLVTIAAPVFNGANYIKQTLENITKQTYPNIEFLISDNCSTDGTWEIIQEFCSNSHHNWTTVRQTENVGALQNFNKLLSMSNGKYFMWLGAHDEWDPNFISEAIELMEGNKDVVLTYTDACWKEPNGELTPFNIPSLDTRGINPGDKCARFNFVMSGLCGCYQVYGLYRTECLKQAEPFTCMLGPDLALLAEIPFYGDIAHIRKPMFQLRRMVEYGSWEKMFAKFNMEFTRSTPYIMYARLHTKHWKIVWKHVPTFWGKIAQTINTWHILAERHFCCFRTMQEEFQRKVNMPANKIDEQATNRTEVPELASK